MKMLQISKLLAGVAAVWVLASGTAFAQTTSAPTIGEFAAKVAAKLDSGKTLSDASPGDLMKATAEAAAEDPENAAKMAVETANYLKALNKPNMEALIVAIAKGAFDGAPNFIAEIAEALIGAFPEHREAINALLRRRLRPLGSAPNGGVGPGFGGGPGGVGGGTGNDDEAEVTPDIP